MREKRGGEEGERGRQERTMGGNERMRSAGDSEGREESERTRGGGEGMDYF